MAFYKKAKMKVNGKWYPKSVLVVSPATTEQVAKRIAVESTVSPADVRAVLTALGGVMGDYMSQGRSVKLDGIGSFYFTAVTTSNGVDKPEDVNATLIRGVRVRFLPETRYRGAGKGRVSTRGLSDVDIDWEEWKGEEKESKGKKEKEKEKEQEKIEAANNANLLPADPDAPLKMSDEARARLRIGLSALALNFAKRA
nr:MAG TPA: DNA-binding protein [Caudoviricetes sp.]